VGVRRFVEDPAPARLRVWCWAVFFAPFVVFAGAEAASRMLAGSSSGTGTFVPTTEAVFTFMAIFSGLGSQLGPAPDANKKGGGR
jgi:hypothetical protein